MLVIVIPILFYTWFGRSHGRFRFRRGYPWSASGIFTALGRFGRGRESLVAGSLFPIVLLIGYLPGWLQSSYGYNYLALGVILAATGTLMVSLLTRHTCREFPGVVNGKPVDCLKEFTAKAETW